MVGTHPARLSEPSPKIPKQLSKNTKSMLPISKKRHGSIYNIAISQRNCSSARTGHYTQAHEILQENFPLHHQDWACPNRRYPLAIDDDSSHLPVQNSTQTLEKAPSVGAHLSMVDEAEKGTANQTCSTPDAWKTQGTKATAKLTLNLFSKHNVSRKDRHDSAQ